MAFATCSDAAKKGLLRELSPGPLAPEARIMPLDQAASCSWILPDRLAMCVWRRAARVTDEETRRTPQQAAKGTPGFESGTC